MAKLNLAHGIEEHTVHPLIGQQRVVNLPHSSGVRWLPADLRLVGEQEGGLRHPEEPLQEGEVDDGREGGEVEVGAEVDEADAGGAAADEQSGAEGVDEVDEEDVGRVAVERPLVRDGQRVAARQHGQQQDEHVHA